MNIDDESQTKRDIKPLDFPGPSSEDSPVDSFYVKQNSAPKIYEPESDPVILKQWACSFKSCTKIKQREARILHASGLLKG